MEILLKNPLNLKNNGYLESLNSFAQKLEVALDTLLPPSETRLHEAMRYSVLDGGKRLRAHLTWTSAQLFSVCEDDILKVGAAIELIHAYSLVHDDLPCMDNSNMRRGKPSCHKAFDEATAVLVGDALIPLAFQTLGALQTSSDIKLDLIECLGEVSGSQGIVAGQMMDLRKEKFSLTLENLQKLQHLKTATLFGFSTEAGAILGKALPEERNALKSYGLLFGKAFQMIDDLLDVWGDEGTLGKPSQQDEEKVTYLNFLTPLELYEKIELLLQEAFGYLSIFNEKANPLKETALFAFNQLNKTNQSQCKS